MIYFIECAGRLKIGFTNHIHKRLVNLQNAAPRPLKLLGCIKGDKHDERRFHDHLREHHSHGEWFKLNDDVRAFIRDALERGASIVPGKPQRAPNPRQTYTPPPMRLSPWSEAIRSANDLLQQYEKLILAMPREESWVMYRIFAESAAKLETVFDGPMDDAAAPAWLAALKLRLGESQQLTS